MKISASLSARARIQGATIPRIAPANNHATSARVSAFDVEGIGLCAKKQTAATEGGRTVDIVLKDGGFVDCREVASRKDVQ